ncbi:MAG TPA: aminotransferase class IV [Acidimicrobiales bacterium]|nr:aminotransferase class IV [Acidimicrobiales bacterium]
MSILWIDGALVDERVARVSPFDHGLLTGDGVFETMKIVRGRAFAARRHLDRLARSTAGMRLPCPPREVVLAAMDEVIAANGWDEGRLRVTVTGGPGALGSDRAAVEPTVIVAGGPLPAWPPAADVAVAPWPRNERGALTGVKSVSYGENVVALAYARDRHAGEALFANVAGNLCEGTGTNVFLGLGGRLVTPPLSAGCLAGVTRDLVMELVDVVEDNVPMEALAGADEAFLTSSTRDVQPIRAIDGRPLPAGPGPLTEGAGAAFRALMERDLDP